MLPLEQKIRNIKRVADIVAVLVKHGFGDVVQELGFEKLIERSNRVFGLRRIVPEFEHLPRKVRLRKAMEELGPTFIKLGQVLSTRPDLIPQEWANEFKLLQNDAPRLTEEEVNTRLKEEFGERIDDLFLMIDHTPLAAASMAQAHRAKMKTGEDVVIKILRPGIAEITRADMESMRVIAEYAETKFSNLGYSPVEVVNQFAKELEKEVDLTLEGRSTDRLRRIFEGDPGVVFPKVFWAATTRNVLTVEEMKGQLLSRLDPATLGVEERRTLVENGARAVLRQCLEVGFFHADPHPGNLFAMPGGAIGFIDCGMTGQLDDRTTQDLAELVAGVARGDLDMVLAVMASLADIDQDKLDDRPFRADVREFVARFQSTPMEELNFGLLLREFFEKLQDHHIRCPGDLVLLIKALTTIEAVASSLDPSFELAGFARPFVEKLVMRKYSVSAATKRMQMGLVKYAELIEDLPREVRGIISQVRKNRFAINLEHRGLSRLTHTIEHASRNISFSLIVASMFVGSSILILASRGDVTWVLRSFGIAGFVASFLLLIIMVVTTRRFKE